MSINRSHWKIPFEDLAFMTGNTFSSASTSHASSKVSGKSMVRYTIYLFIILNNMSITALKQVTLGIAAQSEGLPSSSFSLSNTWADCF